MFIAMRYWSGSRSLVFGTPLPLILTEMPLEYPEATLSHGDPVVIIPQDWTLHKTQTSLSKKLNY